MLHTESLSLWFMDTWVMKGEPYQHVHNIMQSDQHSMMKRNNLKVLTTRLLKDAVKSVMTLM